MKKGTRKLKFKNRVFIYDEKNRLISKEKSPEVQVELKNFYEHEEDMPEELLSLIEATIEEMCEKEYLKTKTSSAEEADDKK